MAQCIEPFILKEQQIPVPCGKCPPCKARRVSAWSFRLMQHCKADFTKSAHFVTLTYDTAHVPIVSSGHMSLRKEDLQRFFKRLRKCMPPVSDSKFRMRYYAAGEYGGKTWRPHYHIIMFNADIGSILKSWQLGSVHFGDVNPASVGYTLKYISKAHRVPRYKGDLRVPEFQLISKGLGENYLTEAIVRYHNQSPDFLYCQTEDQKKSQCHVTTKTKSTTNTPE